MIKTEYIKLENGIKLVLVEDKSKNQTHAEIIVKFGGLLKDIKVLDEKIFIPDGVAHLLEHTLVEDSKYGNALDYFKNYYVGFNAHTSNLDTTFFINTIEDFYTHFKKLIEIVNISVFTNEKQMSIRKPIIEEIKKGKDVTYKKFNDALRECVFNNKKYFDILGDAETIKNIDYNFLKRIYDIFYQPKNQTIFISGNFDIKKIKKLVEEEYSKINKEKIDYLVLDKPVDLKFKSKKYHVIDSLYDPLAHLSFKIDLKNMTPKEKVKLTFYLSHFLRENFDETSEVYKTIIEKKYSTYSVNVNENYSYKDILIVDISLNTDKYDDFKKIILNALKNKQFDKEKFDLWKNEALIQIILRNTHISSSAGAFLENVLTFDYYEEDKIEDIDNLNFDEYMHVIESLDFSNYAFIYQTKK